MAFVKSHLIHTEKYTCGIWEFVRSNAILVQLCLLCMENRGVIARTALCICSVPELYKIAIHSITNALYMFLSFFVYTLKSYMPMTLNISFMLVKVIPLFSDFIC